MAIKIFIQEDKLQGGPGIFKSRLIKSLLKFKDIEITNNIEEKFDIEIAFIKKIYKHKKPYILRLGNCYYFKGYKPWNNKPIAASIAKAEHVIFQSNFAYQLLNRVLRIESRNLIKNNYSIIHNGVDFDYINNIKLSENIEPNSFVACSRWDANKRFISMIKGFNEASTGKHLYIIGGFGIASRKKSMNDIKRKYNSKYIHILGEKSNEETIAIMKACKYQIHLSFIDICPNSVIEGLCCGLNVLCTNLGGTPELVKDNGVILKVDEFWKGKYLKKRIEDLDNLNPKIVAKGIHSLIDKTNNKNKIDKNLFDINYTANQYKNIIDKIIK